MRSPIQAICQALIAAAVPQIGIDTPMFLYPWGIPGGKALRYHESHSVFSLFPNFLTANSVSAMIYCIIPFLGYKLGYKIRPNLGEI